MDAELSEMINNFDNKQQSNSSIIMQSTTWKYMYFWIILLIVLTLGLGVFIGWYIYQDNHIPHDSVSFTLGKNGSGHLAFNLNGIDFDIDVKEGAIMDFIDSL